jgi:hypothetical protein
MIINITYDPSVVGAPAGFQTTVDAVAALYENHFTDNLTLNITVVYGVLGPNGLGQSQPGSLTQISYTNLVTDVANDATTANDTAAALASTDPISGTHTYWMNRGEQKSLGVLSGTDTGSDGTVTFSNAAGTFDYDRTDGIGSSLYDFFGVVAHEFSEIMGRNLLTAGTITSSDGTTTFTNSNYLFDLYHYSAAGTRSFVGTSAGYFSIDNGTANLGDFNTNSGGDFGDWSSAVGNDAQRAFSNSGVINPITSRDYTALDILGWDFVNTAPTVSALTASVGEDGPTFSQNLLFGAADTDGDFLFVENLANSVTTSLGRTLTLGVDYTLTAATLALTAAGFAKFNNLAAGITDSAVFGFDVNDLTAAIHNTFSLSINGLNDAPVAHADAGSAGENEAKLFSVLTNDTDVDLGDTLSLSSLGAVTVSSANTDINGIDASAAFAIVGDQVRFLPGTLFDHLAVGETATAVIGYTIEDSQHFSSSSTLTVTINGENDAPVIQSGGGGDAATYFVRVNESGITKVVATDVDHGDVSTFSIVGGADAGRFALDSATGELSFQARPNQPHEAYEVQVQVSDGHGGVDVQDITVNVTAAKMAGDPAADTFVFHSKFGSNEISNFDVNQDFLQFDRGMFSADTAAAVLAAAAEDHKGNVLIDTHAGDLVVDGVTIAQLQAHSDLFSFV